MGMTMTQKILAKHAGLDEVKAGQLIEANLDLVLGNDVTAPVAIGEMKKMNVDCVFCKDKIALVPDHFTPNKDIKSAELYKCVKQEGWVLNMPYYLRKVWLLLVTLLLVQIHIHVHMVHLVHFQQV